MPVWQFTPRKILLSGPVRFLRCSVVLSFLVAGASWSQTLPTGGSVASGNVTIGKPSGNGAGGAGNTLNITQSSQNAIVNWQSFSIGANSTVNIAQPDSSAAMLDRVTGTTSSSIAGRLNANGQVVLINPNGIAITKSGVVNVGGGLVASTLGISDDDFKNGKLNFKGSGASAAVTNQGAITVGRGGYAALLGGSVNNAGLIAVPLGKVGLGAGEAATLDVSGDGFLQVAVPTVSAAGSAAQGGGPGSALIQSSGTIAANGGTVIMSAATARAAARSAINLSGIVEAHSISGHDGAISLSGGPGGTVNVSGTLDVSGTTDMSGQQGSGLSRGPTAMADGGTVAVTGENIALTGATLNASGGNGGTIDIGGDEHGGGTLPTAATLSVDAGTVITADALGTNAGARVAGNISSGGRAVAGVSNSPLGTLPIGGGTGQGGSVVLWSDEDTNFAGKISATGAAAGGNGGYAEVSSRNLLQYSGLVDLKAPHGQFGTLLLDPYNITIETAGGETNGTLTTTSFTPSGSNSILSVTDLQNALANASVVVSTGGAGSPGSDTGNITVANALTWSSGSTLTLSAYHSIVFEASVALTGNGGLALTTNNGGSGGTLTFWPGASVQFQGTNGNGTAQGSLAIQGNAYTLVNSMTGFASMATGGGSYTALAIPLTSTTNYSGPVVGSYAGTFEGLGNTISNLTINGTTGALGLFGSNSGTIRDFGLLGGSVGNASGTANVGGLVGNNSGTLTHVFNTGTVNAFVNGDNAGGLAGENSGSITSSYATGSVNDGGTGTGQYGGLVGYNQTGGSIDQCFATGSVTNIANSAGGLVGLNDVGASISNSYATGAAFVNNNGGFAAGGLVGDNIGSISNSYATGVPTFSGANGGLVGDNNNGSHNGTVTNSTWDTTSSGTSTGIGYNPTNITITGTATTNMQTAAEATQLGSDFAGGSGIYPYLKSIFPNGIQALTGTVFSDAGVTHLPSGTNGNVPVTITVNGVALGSATANSLGGYYFAVPAGTVTASNALLVYSTAPNSSQSGADLGYAGGYTGLDIYGGGFYDNTPATTYSTAGVATVLGYSTTPSFIASLPLQINARGASFTLDQTLSPTNNFTVNINSGYPITVAAPVTVTGSNTLSLLSGSVLNIDALVNVTGAGTVNLNYSTSSATNLSFAGGSVQFTGGSAGAPQGSLNINGTAYTLVNSMNTLNGGLTLSGQYALAEPLISTASYTGSLIGSIATPFTGTFEGLGNTVSGLSISSSTSSSSSYTGVGLFGAIGSAGTVRDLGLVGGNVSSTGNTNVFIGELAGQDAGAVVQSYATGAVSLSGTGGSTLLGGLVGNLNAGTITASYATGTVTGSTSQNDGGLVGRISGAGTVSQSFASGAVTSGGSGGTGGLVGRIDGSGAVVQYSYATGAVTATNTAGAGNVGGLVGQNNGAINYSYATGAVTNASGSSVGGVVPSGTGGGTQTGTYWDTLTTGITAAGPTGTTGETTAQLQGSITLTFGGGFTGGAAGGTSGVYPYLSTIYPNGIQAVSGIAYKDGGITPYASTSNGAGEVSVTVGGVLKGMSSTGSNGYYYLAVPSGTLSNNGTPVLAYTQNGTGYNAVNGAAITQATGSVSGLNVYGGYLNYPTSLTTYSAASAALSTLESTVTGYSSTPSFVAGLGPYFTASGASFTVDQSPGTLATNFGAQTTSSNASLIVAAPLTLSGGNTLTLHAAGALGLDSNITVTGAGTVALTAATETFSAGSGSTSPVNVAFGTGDSLQFTGGSPGSPQGSLSINGTAYTLVNSMASLDAIDGALATSGGGSVATYGAGLAGHYALAVPLTATGTTYIKALIGSNSNPFTGSFEGLGNTITGLTINNASSYLGLFGEISGTSSIVRDLGLINASVTNSSSTNTPPTGILVAYNSQGTLLQDYTTGSVSSPHSDSIGGLIGASNGFTINSFSTAAVTGDGNIGGLVGHNSLYNGYVYGEILDSYATGAVSSTGGSVGGLAGSNEIPIADSYATGAVSAAGQSNVGGLVGGNTYGSGNPAGSDPAPISNSFAMGAVIGGTNVGGLVGNNYQTNQISSSYSTGTVTGSTTVGRFAGLNNGSISNSYWDSTTSGASTGIASGGTTGSTTGATGYATTSLQGSLPSGFSSSIWGTGTGLYPYLSAIDPNGVQAVSGIAYTDAGSTPLASTSGGAGLVSVLVGGTAEGTVSTGSNGYYYLMMPAGTIANLGSTVLAYTVANVGTGAKNAATLATETGTTTGFNIYGGDLAYTTSALLYSTAVANLSAAETAAEAGANGPASSLFSGLTPSFTATGTSFTLDQALSPAGSFTAQTTATNAPLIVAQALTLAGANTLTLNSAGALAVDAPITVSGAGAVALTYNMASPMNLTFAIGSSINYGTTNNGGTLSINGQSYHLLYKLTDSVTATGNGPDNGTDDIAGIDHSGDTGYYALATSLTGTGSASAAQFSHPLAGSGSNVFNGVFEALGNTITNLTINDSTDANVGLFGASGGTLRDLGLVGGSVSGAASGAYVGDLVGHNVSPGVGSTALVVNAYASGSVSGASNGAVGGLVGSNDAPQGSAMVENSFATGAVSGASYGEFGGLVGLSTSVNGAVTVRDAFASGAVTGGFGSDVGGLVGGNNVAANASAIVQNGYATGAVSGGSYSGGVVGYNQDTVSSAYWDTYTSGTSTGSGGGGGTVQGLTTTALQSSATSGVALSSAFAGGAVATTNGGTNAVYPYLASFYPNGVQAISGFARSGIGSTPLASGTSGAALVSVNIGGSLEGTATTGANGYYYVAMPAGTVSSTPATAVVYSTAPTASQDGATLTTASLSTSTGSITGPTVYGGYLNFSTAATTYSAASTAFATAQTTVAGVTGSSYESALAPFVTATGASFSFDQTLNLSSNFAVQTTAASAPITVSSPLTLGGANALTLNAAGALAIDAPITVTGACSIALAYNNTSPTNLSFAQGDSLEFTGGTAGAPLGSLSINGTAYTLVNSMASLDAIDGYNAVSGSNETALIGAGLTGDYALAIPLNAAGTTYANALIGTYGTSNASTEFTGIFEGLGNTISGLTIVKNGSQAGLFGSVGSGGVVRDVGLIGGSVSGTYSVGDLVGENSGTVVETFATGSVSSSNNEFNVGGLVGYQFASGTVEQSYATGVVSNASNIGGLVGESAGIIQASYATGAVIPGSNSGTPDQDAGGLLGNNYGGTVSQSYATGAVTGNLAYNDHGGLVGINYGTVSQSYWDMTTSGISNGIGPTGSLSTTGTTGLTTMQLQGNGASVTLTGFSGGAAGTANGGTTGEYPYLVNFFPAGVQTVSGKAYEDAGVTPLASTLAGAGLVNVTVNGTLQGTPSTGVNGYYYLAVPAGTIAGSGSTLLAYTVANGATGAQNGATVTTATGSTAGFDVYGGNTRYTTSALTYSTAGASLSTVESYQSTPAFVGTLTPFIVATGTSFTIDTPLTLNASFGVQTTANGAGITIADPITLNGATVLNLDAAGALRFDAPVTITGAAAVALTYNSASAQNLGFGIGDALQFTGTNVNGAAQGTLAINGTNYTLVNSISELDAIDATSAVNGSGVAMYGSGLAGNYALATALNASGTTYTTALVGTNSDGTSATQFAGTFEGLGNTISGLTINSATRNVGLFGFIGSGGVVRDLGLVGGSISGTANYTITNSLEYGTGSLAGENAGLITQSYSTAAVNGTNNTGGLVGRDDGTISYAFATGPVAAANSSSYVGGFAGSIAGTITDAYARGAVTSGSSSYGVGGFAGQVFAAASIADAYSTGDVSDVSTTNVHAIGGFNGAYTTNNGQGPALTQIYFDSTTSGWISDIEHPNVQSLTTAQLQGTATLPMGVTVALAGYSGGAAGGTSSLYPYLSNFYPNGVQSISGVAYKNTGSTLLTSGTSGAGLVSVASAGALDGIASTGHNGYYYLDVPAGTFATNQGVVAFTQANGSTGALDAAQFTQSAGGTSSSINVYGGWLLEGAGSFGTLSALNAAYSSAVGSTAAASLGPANVQITGTGGFGIDTSLTASGTLSLQFTGAVSESGGAALNATNLILTGSGGSYALNDTNTVGTLAASTGSVSLVDVASLSTGSLTNATGTITSGVATTGTVSLVSAGGITIASGDGVSGQSPVIAATGAFTNDAGVNGVSATAGNWLIYSSAPGADTFGALNSNDTAIFGVTYATLAPGAVTVGGNRYLFANQPVLTVAPIGDTKVYGVDDSAGIAGDYAITGFPSVSGVFLADTASNAVTGSATVTSAGSAQYAPVNGSPYAMSVSLGTLSSTGYTFQTASGGGLGVTQATITVAGATNVDKAYDGSTALVNGALGFTSSGVFGPDAANVSITAAGDIYAGPNAGLQNINVTGLSLSGSAASNYMLSANAVTGSGTINPAVINLTGTRVYDATPAANASAFLNAGTIAGVAGQLLTLTGSGTLAAKGVGNEPVTALGSLTLGNGGSGSSAGLAQNYTLVGGTDVVNVTQLGIAVTATATGKPYDASNAATVSLASSGVLSNDVVTFGDTSATFDTPNAGIGKTVTVSGLSLGGTDGGNYSVSNANATATTTATITPAVINLSGTRVYDATSTANASAFLSAGTLPGVAGQLLTLTGSGTLAAKGVGNEAVTALGSLTLGNGGSGSTAGLEQNYTLVGGTDTVNVTALGINVTATAADKVYDGNTAASVILGSSGVLSNDVVTFGDAAANFDTKNVGNGKTVTVTGLTLGGTDANNYSVSNANATTSTTADITPATVSAVTGILANNKVYDATTAAILNTGSASFQGEVSGDSLTVASATGVFDTKNVGNGKTVSIGGITLGGADAGNYLLASNTATSTADITPATITVAGATGVNKTYDGTTALPSGASGFTSGGIFAVDAGAITVTAANAAYASAAVGPEAVAVSGLHLTGAAAGNYVLSATQVVGSGTIAAAGSGSGGSGGSSGGAGGGSSGGSSGSGGTGGSSSAGSTGSGGSAGGSGSGGSGGTAGNSSGGAGGASGGSGSGSGSGSSGAGAGGAGDSSSGGSGTPGAAGSGSSGGTFTLPALGSSSSGAAGASGAAGSGTFVLSGTPVSSTTNGDATTTTVVGSIRNDAVTIDGTFIVSPRAAATSGSLPYEIAASETETVTYVPGTLRAQLTTDDTGNGFASTAAAAAMNEEGQAFDSMPIVFAISDDSARPWEAIDTLGNPGFDTPIVCVKGHCAAVVKAGKNHGAPAAVSR